MKSFPLALDEKHLIVLWISAIYWGNLELIKLIFEEKICNCSIFRRNLKEKNSFNLERKCESKIEFELFVNELGNKNFVKKSEKLSIIFWAWIFSFFSQAKIIEKFRKKSEKNFVRLFVKSQTKEKKFLRFQRQTEICRC